MSYVGKLLSVWRIISDCPNQPRQLKIHIAFSMFSILGTNLWPKTRSKAKSIFFNWSFRLEGKIREEQRSNAQSYNSWLLCKDTMYFRGPEGSTNQAYLINNRRMSWQTDSAIHGLGQTIQPIEKFISMNLLKFL